MTLSYGAVCSLNAQWVSKSFIKCPKEPFFKESNVDKVTLKKLMLNISRFNTPTQEN